MRVRVLEAVSLGVVVSRCGGDGIKVELREVLLCLTQVAVVRARAEIIPAIASKEVSSCFRQFRKILDLPALVRPVRGGLHIRRHCIDLMPKRGQGVVWEVVALPQWSYVLTRTRTSTLAVCKPLLLLV